MIDLLSRAQQGDDDAFVALFEQYKLALWKAAMAVLANEDDAADALQETAVKAWRALPRFRGSSDLGTWLTRILLRTCYDELRKSEHETPYASTGQGGFDEQASGGSPRPPFDERRALVGGAHEPDRDEALDVRAAVGLLSADDRLLLTFFYVDDYPVRHIAALLNLSEGAVRTRLSRARSKFSAAYGANLPKGVESA